MIFKPFSGYAGQMQWDTYKHFYKQNENHFVHFYTGETVLHAYHNISCNYRRHYNDLGVAILFPSEMPKGEFQTVDGEKIPRAWLDVGGQPTLVWDKESNLLMQAERKYYNRNWELKPVDREYLDSAVVIFREGQTPEARFPIIVSRPRQLTLDEKRYVSKLVKLCKVTAKLDQNTTMLYKSPVDMNEYIDFTITPDEMFKRMTPEIRKFVGNYGLNFGRTEERYTHLKFVPK